MVSVGKGQLNSKEVCSLKPDWPKGLNPALTIGRFTDGAVRHGG